MASALCQAMLIAVLVISATLGCRRIPHRDLGAVKAKQPGDNGFRLVIAGDPTEYVADKIYNLFLLGTPENEFNHFMINAQAVSNSTTNTDKKRLTFAGPRRVGRFQLFSDATTRFNEDCVNTVVAADNQAKAEIQVMWVAPKTGSGCVSIAAMVYQQTGQWYAEDGALTKMLCEATPESQQKKMEVECCACDEAKYSFVFEGIWSNETHPRDYPFAVWLTHFSDVIGASHDTNFSFWGANHLATDGFQLMAEFGSVRLLETELRAKGSRLRTLIKAAGLWYPYVNTNTSTTFRVDRVHHKVSLTSMFGPSPDWVVGVSGLNLCNKDCSWTDSLDIDLYPWDAGTDSGISYMSPNAQTQPRERMYPITTMYPEDPRQPFYNPASSQMTPLARLYIRKEKQIPRACDATVLEALVLDVSENAEDSESTKPECAVTEFGEWTPCSVTCGKGIRMRSRFYADEAVAKTAKCTKQLVNKEMCVADVAECGEPSDDEVDDDLSKRTNTVGEDGEGVGVCKTTPWSDWSPCSATCGIGISMRTRTFVAHAGRKLCPHISVVEKEKCMKPECSVDEMEVPDPDCPVTMWSDWGPCSVSCGNGVRIRARQLLNYGPEAVECAKQKILSEQAACSIQTDCIFDAEQTKEICSLPTEVGRCRESYQRFAFDSEFGGCKPFSYSGCRGNRNNFLTLEECRRMCQRNGDHHSLLEAASNLIVASSDDCQLSDWSEWSPCSVTCGSGISERSRRILREARNGGAECPIKLVKRRRCHKGTCR